MISEQSGSAGSRGRRSTSRSQTDRRIAALLLVLALIGAPAVVLRVLCAGKACVKEASVSSAVPFCSLPDRLRTLVHSGFRAGRSPDVLAVTKSAVVGGTGLAKGWPGTPWPSAAVVADTKVPIVFTGAGVQSGAQVPDGATLDRIAPTEARILGFNRPHPEVRSGAAITEVTSGSAPPPLVVQVVWKGVGTSDLRDAPGDWPELKALTERGAATLDGDTGALPVDPAASLTTIGTGGLPYQHGIVSRVVLNDSGRLVRAWGPGAPVSVIATLADDLDDHLHQRARIGLVGTDESDRGAIGGNWYIDADEDDVHIVDPDRVPAEAVKLLGRGYGDDSTPDLLTVVEQGSVASMDSGLGRIVRALPASATVVVTATGSLGAGADAVPAKMVASEVEAAIRGRKPVVAAAAPGGLYLDQKTLAAEKIPDDEIISALERAQSEGGERLMDQVFPAIAVSFSRYC